MNRRVFMSHSVATAVAGAFTGNATAEPATHDVTTPKDFTGLYEVSRSPINLENAYFVPMTKRVAAEYAQQLGFVNRYNVSFVRDALPSRKLSDGVENARSSVAHLIGAVSEEIALTRSGTEALQNLIVNFRLIDKGDAVIYADLDFDAMQFAMDFLEERRGAHVVRFVIPEPATTANILAAYDEVLKTPRARILLLTHISHRTGLVLPINEIAAMARARGVDVILDAAQSVGQIPFEVDDCGIDFMGFSLHKWVGAPLGTGAMYVRKARLAAIDPCFDNRDWPIADIRARVLTGTSNFAATLTVPSAIEEHNRIGAQQKRVHLQLLRDRWVSQLRTDSRVNILTPDESERYGATTSFRLPNLKNYEDALRIQKVLVERFGILTAARKGISAGAAIRVTPALYNTIADMDRLVVAVRTLVGV